MYENVSNKILDTVTILYRIQAITKISGHLIVKRKFLDSGSM
jgi:hypothetical protein